MNHRSFNSRRGLTFTEVVVAATLVVSMIGFVAPLTVRVGRVWQSTRQYRLAFNELANQMELLTSLGVSGCNAALTNLKPSASVAESLPEARLEGQLLRDQDGTRLILSIDWDRGAQSVPVSLVGWLDTDSVEPMPPLRRAADSYRKPESTPETHFTTALSNKIIAREGEAPAEPLRRMLGGSLALPMGEQP